MGADTSVRLLNIDANKSETDRTVLAIVRKKTGLMTSFSLTISFEEVHLLFSLASPTPHLSMSQLRFYKGKTTRRSHTKCLF